MVRKLYLGYFLAIMVLTVLELLSYIHFEDVVLSVLALIVVLMSLTHAPVMFHTYVPIRTIEDEEQEHHDLTPFKHFFFIVLPLLIYLIVVRFFI